MNKETTKSGAVEFLKRYGYIIVMGVVLIATAIVLAFTLNRESPEPVDTLPTTFYSPIMNATVAKEYSSTSLLYNSTLKQWEAHKAVTFTVGANADVYAVLDGKVKEIYTNYLDGTVIVLEHAGNILTSYGSLDETALVKVGDLVTRGQKIGVASNTAHAEYNLGNHMQFKLFENGVSIDPTSYLNLENK